MIFHETLRRAFINFKAAAHNPNNPTVQEDADTLGYFMEKRFRGATKQTKAALLNIMPEAEWEKMRENAWTDFIREGSYYEKDSV